MHWLVEGADATIADFASGRAVSGRTVRAAVVVVVVAAVASLKITTFN